MSPKQKQLLEKQQYRFVGHHSAVKVCGWTKNYLRGKGGCYKFTFYGIRSHQCLQMTSSMFCASRCVFCWRGEKAPVTKDWYGPLDEPKAIIEGALDAQFRLLQGFRGSQNADKQRVKEMEDVRHVALSLTGEPITYPKLDELLDGFHKRRISTFLVTNAQYPDQIKRIRHVTQFYLSVDAPNKALLKAVDNPLFSDYWERNLKCLDVLATRPFRTCIRLTMIKGLNMCDAQGYADLISRGKPHFIELKGYMWLGSSRERLKMENMPLMEDIEAFAQEVLRLLPDYCIRARHLPSRVILLTRKDFAKKTFIDFDAFFTTVASGNSLTPEAYSVATMQPNL